MRFMFATIVSFQTQFIIQLMDAEKLHMTAAAGMGTKTPSALNMKHLIL